MPRRWWHAGAGLATLSALALALTSCGDSQQDRATPPPSPIHGMWHLAEDARSEVDASGRVGFFYFAPGGSFEHYADRRIYTGTYALHESRLSFDVAGEDPVPPCTWTLHGSELRLVFNLAGRTKTTRLRHAPAEQSTPAPFGPLGTRFADALRIRVGAVVAESGKKVRFGAKPDVDLRHAIAFFRLDVNSLEESRPARAELVFRFAWLRGAWHPLDGRVQVEDGERRSSFDLFEARADGGLELNDSHPFARAAVAAWGDAVGGK